MDHHPIADLFPMLAEDELRELAADIKQRGQLQPIMLDEEGSILDGRNRNAACDLAGVEPWYETYKGDDPDGYALSVNVNRREMGKGQKAMVAASAEFLVTKKYGEQGRLAHLLGVSSTLLSQAKTVCKFAPELVGEVIAGLPGSKTLDEAYKVAKAKKDEQRSREPGWPNSAKRPRTWLFSSITKSATSTTRSTRPGTAPRSPRSTRS